MSSLERTMLACMGFVVAGSLLLMVWGGDALTWVQGMMGIRPW